MVRTWNISIKLVADEMNSCCHWNELIIWYLLMPSNSSGRGYPVWQVCLNTGWEHTSWINISGKQSPPPPTPVSSSSRSRWLPASICSCNEPREAVKDGGCRNEDWGNQKINQGFKNRPWSVTQRFDLIQYLPPLVKVCQALKVEVFTLLNATFWREFRRHKCHKSLCLVP